MMGLNTVVHLNRSVGFLRCCFSAGHHTKNSDANTDSYEDILRKTRDESLGERVRGRILSGNYFLLEE